MGDYRTALPCTCQSVFLLLCRAALIISVSSLVPEHRQHNKPALAALWRQGDTQLIRVSRQLAPAAIPLLLPVETWTGLGWLSPCPCSTGQMDWTLSIWTAYCLDLFFNLLQTQSCSSNGAERMIVRSRRQVFFSFVAFAVFLPSLPETNGLPPPEIYCHI